MLSLPKHLARLIRITPTVRARCFGKLSMTVVLVFIANYKPRISNSLSLFLRGRRASEGIQLTVATGQLHGLVFPSRLVNGFHDALVL